MPHGKIVIVFVAVFFVTAILRGLERPGTAIVDHPVFTVVSPFRLTPPITPAFLPSLTIRTYATVPAVSGRSTISCLLFLPRPPS
jgi:hypothetical protein